VEEVGRWPSALTEGYITLIPKGEGMEPTAMRPLSVLSAIYRLWAGVRLRDVIVWQEAWIHPNAYGFRRGKGTGDAYSLLAAIVELARLRGEDLDVVGLDYVKCFDRVPQEVVLRLAMELGMDPRLCRALAGMYQELKRRFKVNGCLGAAFHATNGILQGCPLSVALINMLTTVWKRLIEEHNAGYRLQPNIVVPFPNVTAPVDLEGIPLIGPQPAPPQQEDVDFVMPPDPPPQERLVGLGYADDTYVVAPSTPNLQSSLVATEEWLTVTDQGVNGSKSLHATVRKAAATPTPVQILGVHIPPVSSFRMLGATVETKPQTGPPPLLAKRIARATQLAGRIQHVQLDFDAKATLLSSLAVPTALFGAEVGRMQGLEELETAFVLALWGPHRPMRAKEIIFSVLAKGHRICPALAVIHDSALWLAKAARQPGTLQDVLHAAWQVVHRRRRPMASNHIPGPFSRALATLQKIGWEMVEGWWRWRIPLPEGRRLLDLRTQDVPALKHAIREALRHRQLVALAQRRPDTFGGVELGVDMAATQAWLKMKSHTQEARGVLRGLLTVGTWTASRIDKRDMRTEEGPNCPFCNMLEIETEFHLLWRCPAWDAIRQPLREILESAMRKARIQYSPHDWPACFSRCALIPLAWSGRGGPKDATKEVGLRMHDMASAILLQRKAVEEASEQGPHKNSILFPHKERSRKNRRGGAGATLPFFGPLTYDDSERADLLAEAALGRLADARTLTFTLRPIRATAWGWHMDMLPAILDWLRALRWPTPPTESVSYFELALDFEAFSGELLPAATHKPIMGLPIPLRERAHVLQLAMDAIREATTTGRPFLGESVLRGDIC
jgi:hypothetical protein